MSNASYPGALPPPPGVVPNLINPDKSRQVLWIACIAVISFFPFFLVPIRLYIRACIMRKVSMVDYTVAAAWVLYIPLAAVAFLLSKYGQGLHGWDVSPEEFSSFSQVVNIHEIVWNPTCAIAKAALLLQLMEIFVTRKYNQRWWTIVVLIVLNCIFFGVVSFLQIFECVPREAIWDPNVKGSCINVERTFVATAAINLFDDLIILALPLVWIWQLQAAGKRKFVIALVFATGVFAILASTLRLIQSIYSVGDNDLTYAVLPISLWAQAEISLAMVICCLPVLPRLLSKRRGAATTNSGSNPTEPLSPISPSRSRKTYFEMGDVERVPSHLNRTSQSFNLPPSYQSAARKSQIDKVLAVSTEEEDDDIEEDEQQGRQPQQQQQQKQGRTVSPGSRTLTRSPASGMGNTPGGPGHTSIWKTIDIRQISSEKGSKEADSSSTEALR